MTYSFDCSYQSPIEKNLFSVDQCEFFDLTLKHGLTLKHDLLLKQDIQSLHLVLTVAVQPTFRVKHIIKFNITNFTLLANNDIMTMTVFDPQYSTDLMMLGGNPDFSKFQLPGAKKCMCIKNNGGR